MNLTNRLFVTCIAVYVLYFCSAVFAQDEAQAEIYDAYFSTEIANTSKADKTKFFSCKGDIYAMMKLRGLSKQQHKIESFWYGPDGKLKGKHQADFQFVMDGTTYTPSISLLGSSASPYAILLGTNNTSFIGDWKLKVELDGKLLHQDEFSVLC